MVIMLKHQLNLFFIALSFFTRLPVPRNLTFSQDGLNHAARYFSLVGLLLALILVMVWQILSVFLPDAITIILLMAFSLMLTGAFHEDGLADMADGCGGGFSVSEKLHIMKDSRLGTYGASALFLALLLKYQALININDLVIALLVAYPLSRALAASYLFDMIYVRADDSSKSKPLAQQMTWQELMLLSSIGLLPLLLLPLNTALVIVCTLVVFRWLFKRWLLKQLHGFTGDCLGAAQQLAELVIYLVIIAMQAQVVS
jgi:adenosylcobinamide-GDP ribazoletransferase